ncbi:MAG: hypothetical protein KDJ22_07140 [Candidatus Competibacteraceae bacterium]|jgi:Tfp pilus assembly protein PilO|nr:hypothetical protein [Candidatus Competibacteraceae bacterium]
MSSKIPATLDKLERILSPVARVLRVLEGRSLPIDGSTRLPLIALRLSQDRPGSTVTRDVVVTLPVTIEIAASSEDETHLDTDLANLLYRVRAALLVADDNEAFDKLAISGSLQFEAATYGYPEPGSQYAIVQQPISLRIAEHYQED